MTVTRQAAGGGLAGWLMLSVCGCVVLCRTKADYLHLHAITGALFMVRPSMGPWASQPPSACLG